MFSRRFLGAAVAALIVAGAFASSAMADAAPPSLQEGGSTGLWFPTDFAGYTSTCTSPTSGGTATTSTSGWSGLVGPFGPNQWGIGGVHGGTDGRGDPGLYGGTYTLDQTVTFAPDGGGLSDITGKFTIASQIPVVAGDGTTTLSPVKVVGTIDHKAPYAFDYEVGTCGLDPTASDSSTLEIDVIANYSAKITLASGASYLDAGTVEIYHHRCAGDPSSPCSNLVNFWSYTGDIAPLVPGPPPAPTSTSQCQNGGWKTFDGFKNQGDCVSSVASKGKNKPKSS